MQLGEFVDPSVSISFVGKDAQQQIRANVRIQIIPKNDPTKGTEELVSAVMSNTEMATFKLSTPYKTVVVGDHTVKAVVSGSAIISDTPIGIGPDDPSNNEMTAQFTVVQPSAPQKDFVALDVANGLPNGPIVKLITMSAGVLGVGTFTEAGGAAAGGLAVYDDRTKTWGPVPGHLRSNGPLVVIQTYSIRDFQEENTDLIVLGNAEFEQPPTGSPQSGTQITELSVGENGIISVNPNPVIVPIPSFNHQTGTLTGGIALPSGVLVVAGDFDGNGVPDVATYQKKTKQWKPRYNWSGEKGTLTDFVEFEREFCISINRMEAITVKDKLVRIDKDLDIQPIQVPEGGEPRVMVFDPTNEQTIVAGDFDGDQKDELWTVDPENLTIKKINVKISFNKPVRSMSASSGVLVAAGEFDEVTHNDVVVPGANGAVRINLNTFEPMPFPGFTGGVHVVSEGTMPGNPLYLFGPFTAVNARQAAGFALYALECLVYPTLKNIVLCGMPGDNLQTFFRCIDAANIKASFSTDGGKQWLLLNMKSATQAEASVATVRGNFPQGLLRVFDEEMGQPTRTATRIVPLGERDRKVLLRSETPQGDQVFFDEFSLTRDIPFLDNRPESLGTGERNFLNGDILETAVRRFLEVCTEYHDLFIDYIYGSLPPGSSSRFGSRRLSFDRLLDIMRFDVAFMNTRGAAAASVILTDQYFNRITRNRFASVLGLDPSKELGQASQELGTTDFITQLQLLEALLTYLETLEFDPFNLEHLDELEEAFAEATGRMPLFRINSVTDGRARLITPVKLEGERKGNVDVIISGYDGEQRTRLTQFQVRVNPITGMTEVNLLPEGAPPVPSTLGFRSVTEPDLGVCVDDPFTIGGVFVGSADNDKTPGHVQAAPKSVLYPGSANHTTITTSVGQVSLTDDSFSADPAVATVRFNPSGGNTEPKPLAYSILQSESQIVLNGYEGDRAAAIVAVDGGYVGFDREGAQAYPEDKLAVAGSTVSFSNPGETTRRQKVFAMIPAEQMDVVATIDLDAFGGPGSVNLTPQLTPTCKGFILENLAQYTMFPITIQVQVRSGIQTYSGSAVVPRAGRLRLCLDKGLIPGASNLTADIDADGNGSYEGTTTFGLVTSVQEDVAVAGLWPNPASSVVHLPGVTGAVDAYDVQGVLVSRLPVGASGSVDVSGLVPGTYVLVTTDGTTWQRWPLQVMR